jgi:murein DD-endopeptidase
MRLRLDRRALVALAGLAPLGVQARSDTSFDLRVPAAPMLRSVDGTNEVVYELLLDNHALADLKPMRVEVRDANGDRVLATFEGPALEQRLDRSGVQWNAQTYDAIPSGRRAVVFIELGLVGRLPKALRHRVTYTDTRSGSGERWVDGGDTVVVIGQTPELSPPLRGGPWIAVYDARWERGHRRVGYAIGGKLRTPGRYAVDWVKLDMSGRTSPAGTDLVADAYSHGEDVLAAGDGVIVHVHDQEAERARRTDKFGGAQGNHLVLELDRGGHVHYGHLRPGSSIRRPGERVRAGDKIAEVGFSGSASDPQLHFALTDGPVELASEGLAYTFNRYRVLGRYGDVSQMGVVPWTPAPSEMDMRSAMPSSLSVVQWIRSGTADREPGP